MTIEKESASSLFDSDGENRIQIAQGNDYEYSTSKDIFTFYKYEVSGLLVLDPRPAQSALRIIYPADYEPYIFNEMGWFVRWAKKTVQTSKVKKICSSLENGSNILDVGCGNGSLLRSIKSHHPESYNLYGNDLAKECLDKLSAIGITTHSESIYDLLYENHFDVVILNQVIEHFDDPARLLRKCYDILKPGGKIFIETPSSSGLDYTLFQSSLWGGYHFPRHFYIFNDKNIRLLLKESEFSDFESEYLLSPAFWTQSLHHFFVSRGFERLAKFFHLKNPILTMLVSFIDFVRIKCSLKTSNMRILAKKPNYE